MYVQDILRKDQKVIESRQFFATLRGIASRPWLAAAGSGRGWPGRGDEPPFIDALPAPRRDGRGAASSMKRWSRPVSRVLYVLRRDSHSSRPGVAAWLQQPTREQRGPRYRSPIWSCSEWGLPCRTALAPYAVRSCRTLSPLPVPELPEGSQGHRRSALCCTGRQLTLPRSYLALCPVEPGLSSMRLRATRLSGRLHREV